ncbi:MAG: hypothetical protein SFV53_06575, partial [Rickettsiales bacterium]|nr:hypothetical protein [Rickettsiales bacterium]
MKDFTATKKINLSDQKSLSRTILKKDLIAAIKTANEKITSENFLNEDEFITSFGCKNIEEYLDYLAALKTDSIANAEKTQSLINKDSIKAESSIAAENYQSLINKDSIKAESSIAAENYQSRQFFHIFLLEFHRIRAARSLAKVDNELNEYQ